MILAAGSESLTTSLMDRVRVLEQRGKSLLEKDGTSTSKPSDIRRTCSTNSIFENDVTKVESCPTIQISMSEEKRCVSSSVSTLPPLPISAARRLFRSSLASTPMTVIENTKTNGELSLRAPTPDALGALQQELSNLAVQREEERARLTASMNQMKSSAEQTRAEYERRLLDKEESLSRSEFALEQSNKRISQLEEELILIHETSAAQERDLDMIRAEFSLHSNAANQLRTLLTDVSDKLRSVSGDSGDTSIAPPLPPPSCQSITVLVHSVSACVRNAWEQTANARAQADRLNSEIAAVKLDCSRTVEKIESDKARTIAAIQAEAEHALKLGQQRLSAAQDRLRSAEEQLVLTREDFSKQLCSRESQLEALRNEFQKLHNAGENDRSNAIGRATEAERLLAESESNRLRATALAADADARSHQLELELDEAKRRYSQLESELAGEHERLCRAWQADDERSTRVRESEARETILRQRISELEQDFESNISEFKRAIADIQSQHQVSEEELTAARERVSELTEELDNAVACIADHKIELEKVRQIVAENEKCRESMSNECSNASKLLEEAQAKYIAMEKAKLEVDEELASAKKEMDQLRKDSISSRLAAAESMKASKLLSTRRRELENQAKEENDRLREEIDKLLGNLGEQEKLVASLTAEKKQLEAVGGCQQSEQLAAMRALAKKLANAERQILSFRQPASAGVANSRSLTEADGLATKLKLTEERLSDALGECANALSQRNESEKRAHEAVNIVEQLKDKLEGEKTRVILLNQEFAKVSEESKQQRVQLEAAGFYIRRLEAELVRRTKAGLVKDVSLDYKKVAECIVAEKDGNVKKSTPRRRNNKERRGKADDKQTIASPLSPAMVDYIGFDEFDVKRMLFNKKKGDTLSSCSKST